MTVENIEKLFERIPPTAVKVDEPQRTDESPSFLDGCRVRVSIEIGWISLSIEDLIALERGEVFELEVPAENVVTLKVGSEKIGSARLNMRAERTELEILSIDSVLDRSQRPESTIGDVCLPR